MKEHTITRPQGRLHYWFQPGRSPVGLVFLHGMTCDHQYFLPQFEAFTDTYPLLAWDAPLHGRSRPYDGFRFQDGAEDLEAVLEEVGLDHIVLIGHSMGGVLAQHYLKADTNRALGLVAIDSLPIRPSYYTGLDLLGLEQYPHSLKDFSDEIIRYGIASFNTETLPAHLYMRECLANYNRDDLIGLIATYSTQFIAELSPLSFEIPGLICVGTHDQNQLIQRLSPIWAFQEKLAFHAIPSAGHCASYDHPSYTNRLLIPFIEGIANKL